MIKLTFYEMKDFFIDTLNKLKGRDKRIFAAEIAMKLGKGGQSLIAKEFEMSRITIRKGTREIQTGIPIEDAFHLRHRKRAEEHLPNLLNDLKSVVDSQSQADPDFETNRLYTRLSLSVIHSSEVPSTLMFNTLFHKFMYGYGSAMAVFIIFECFVLTVVIQNCLRLKK